MQDAFDDPVGGQAVAVVQGGEGAGVEELIGKGDRLDPASEPGPGRRGGGGLEQATDDGLLEALIEGSYVQQAASTAGEKPVAKTAPNGGRALSD